MRLHHWASPLWPADEGEPPRQQLVALVIPEAELAVLAAAKGVDLARLGEGQRVVAAPS